MKLAFFSSTNEYIAGEAYDILDLAQTIADSIGRYVTVYNHQPGQHKHGSVYLIKQPVVIDTPLADVYGG